MNTYATTSSGGADAASGFIIMCMIVALLCLYFLPSIIAVYRGVNVAFVICINLFFGWTFFGWLSAFISACATTMYVEPVVVQVQNVYHPSDAPQQIPNPGWYTDPRDAGNQRYWDGLQWTEHIAIR